MKILFLADLHLVLEYRATVLRQLRTIRDMTQPHVIVVAGDLAASFLANEACATLRSIFDIQPIAFALGNKDLWLSGWRGLSLNTEDIIERYWRPAALSHQIVLLDERNADLGEVIVSGGYGHYDFGFATPDYRIGDHLISREDYERGITSGGVLISNDPRMLACAHGTELEAKRQARNIARRVDAAIATDKPVLMVTHTVPFVELNARNINSHCDEYSLAAYSGNSLVGEMIKTRATRIDLLVCGHTHTKVSERAIHGVRSLNLGSSYGRVQSILYDTASRQICWHSCV